MKRSKKVIWGVSAVLCAVLLVGCTQTIKVDPIYRTQEEWAARMKAMNSEVYQPNKEITSDYDSAYAAKCSNGTFVGKIEDKDVKVWKGIPFASIPARFERSVAPQESDKVYEAYYYGKSSLQTSGPKPDNPGYEQGDLDCLTLAVYSVDNNIKNKPVMFYIHGGGWQTGSTSWAAVNPKNFSHYNPDVVTVEVTYRLGIEGQINLGAKTNDGSSYVLSDYESRKDEFKTSCNNGMLDILQGLRWTKENVGAFGGDANKITIAGESAGACAVTNLILMDSDPDNKYLDHSENLFQQAIVFSGGFNQQWSMKRSESVVRKLAQDFGAKSIKDLQNIDFGQLEQWWWKFENNMIGNFCVADGEVLPLDSHKVYQENVGKDINVLYAANTNEFDLFQIFWKDYIDSKGKTFNDVVKGAYKTCTEATPVDESFVPSKQFKDALDGYMKALDELGYKTQDEKIDAFVDDQFLQGIPYYLASEHAKNGGKVYTLAWDQEFDGPFSILKASHGSEGNYMFGNFDGGQFAGTNEEVDLSIIFQHMLGNFIKSGNPSADGYDWKAYDTNSESFLYAKVGDIRNIEHYQSDRIKYITQMYESDNVHYKYMVPYTDMFLAGGVAQKGEFFE